MKKIMFILTAILILLVIIGSALKPREEETQIQTAINEEMNVAAVSEGNKNQETNETVLELQENSSEEYIEEVVLEAKWGDGEGEIGIRPYPESCPAEGPRDYYITNNGEIYILDQVNNRIQIFNMNGKFIKKINYHNNQILDSVDTFFKITVDNMSNIFLLCSKTYPSRDGLIIKYNDKGEIINKICLPINDFLDIFPEEIKKPYFGQIISIMDLRFENGNINIYIGNSIN